MKRRRIEIITVEERWGADDGDRVRKGRWGGMTAERIEDRKDEGECFVGLSAHVAELRRFVAEGARHELPVLLIGERGLRQEQIARAVHHLSARWGQPFIAVNAQSLPSDELDRLLFGSRGVLVGGGGAGTVYLNELVRLPSLCSSGWRSTRGAALAADPGGAR